MDPLERLWRDDKWFLGGGKGALYAPPFPKFLSAPGFWDECFLADVRIPRLFTLLFLDARGRPLRLNSEVADWRPDRLRIVHRGRDLEILETRVVTEGNAWVSVIEIRHAPEPLEVFLWTHLEKANPGHGAPWQSLGDVQRDDEGIVAEWSAAWPVELRPDRTAVESERLAAEGAMGPALNVSLAFGSDLPLVGSFVGVAQRHDESPLYVLSPLPDRFRSGRLHEGFRTEGEGLLHILQHYRMEPGTTAAFGVGAGLSRAAALRARGDVAVEATAASESAWRRYFDSVPHFACSDPFLTQAYWYRWYGLRVNTVDLEGLPVAGTGQAFAPFVTEGIGFFRNFVTYSAQAHLREAVWMHDPALAIGILDNLAAVQREDGSFPGHNYSCRPARDFYHADFATGVERLHALHPGAVGKSHLGALRRYADYFLRHRTMSRDPAGPTLYDVFDQNETGQEYMSRYAFAGVGEDDWASFRVSGVDATVYVAELFRVLAAFRAGDSSYRAYEGGALAGLRHLAFDPDAQFFCDVAPDGRRSPERPATGLYPLMLPALADMPLDGVVDRWLENPDEFWLHAGFPATARTDATYSPEGEWRGVRLNCPWNGRSWPMANSHLVDALAAVARRRPRHGERAGEALRKALGLMFWYGNPRLPNSFEHYNPETGVPSGYRGYDDYMHSWIVDLILRHVVGVQPGSDEVAPLAMKGVEVVCTDIPHPRGRMHVHQGRVTIEG